MNLKHLTKSEIAAIDAEINPTFEEQHIWNLLIKGYDPSNYPPGSIFHDELKAYNPRRGTRLKRYQVAELLNLSESSVTRIGNKLTLRVLATGILEKTRGG